MLNLRHAHGSERILLQVRQLREYERVFLGSINPSHERRGPGFRQVLSWPHGLRGVHKSTND